MQSTKLYEQHQAKRGLLSSRSQSINESANFCFLQSLSVIFGIHRDCPWSPASCRDYRPRTMASCRDCPCDSASCQDSRQQEAIYQAQESLQEARDCGQSRQKPNMADSLCRKKKLADSFIPCVDKGFKTLEHQKWKSIFTVNRAPDKRGYWE